MCIALSLTACEPPLTQRPDAQTVQDAEQTLDDAAQSDVLRDAHNDAYVDVNTDAHNDAGMDATADATVDIPIDATVDAARDTGQSVDHEVSADSVMTDPCLGLTLCDSAGWFCDGDDALTCLADVNGCLVETRTDCTLQPGGYCSAAGVLAGCRQDLDPCEGFGTCPAELYCDGDVLRTCISDDDGCASIRSEQDCSLMQKICVDSLVEAACVSADPSAVSVQIQAVRDAIDAANTNNSLPAAGDWDIEYALVTYVKAPLGADPGGFVIQGERDGPALFVEHEDPVGIVEVGDEVSIWLDQANLVQQRHHVTGLGWLDIWSNDNDVSGWIQDLSTLDIVSQLEDYEFELMTLDAVIRATFSSAGSGFVDARIDTQAVIGSDNVRLRIPTALHTSLLGARQNLIGCSVSVGPTPMWRYLSRAQPSAFVLEEIELSCP